MTIVALMAQTAGTAPVESIAQTFGVDWNHLTAQLISFSIVCVVLYWLAYKPVLRMLDARRLQIAQGLANSEKIKAALDDIEAQRQGVMAEARAEATRVIADARGVAERLQEQAAQRAATSAEQILQRGREAAVLEHDRMLAELRSEVGHLVTKTAAAVIGKVLTEDDQLRLVEETTKELILH
jgi:F-type H+-transporting ATPase subunit b